MARAGEAAVVSDSRTALVPARPAHTPTSAARGVVAIDRLGRLVRQLQAELGRAEERADSMAFEIAALKRALTDDASGRLARTAGEARDRARDARRLAAHEAALRAAAAEGARGVEFRSGSRGAAEARVGDSKWFELPQLPASLLGALAYGTARGSDGFPEWQSFDTVGEHLARKTGKTLSRRALTQIVYRLRGLMADNGANPRLLQVSRRQGLRLLLRHLPFPG